MRQTKFISFSSQKGGVGKSTITTMVASALHFTTPLRVAVVDCDCPQYTIHNYRLDQLDELKLNPEKLAAFEAQAKPAYAILECEVKDAPEELAALNGQVDLVLVDTPGTLNVEGLAELLQKLDYIFIPLETDEGTLTSSLAYIDVLKTVKGQAEYQLAGFHCFWNKLVRTEKAAFQASVEALLAQEEVPLLAARLEQSVHYKKREVRSTLFPLQSQYANLGITRLLEEIQSIVFPVAVVA